MTPLRQKMIDIMVLKGLSPRTQSTYLYAVEKVARHYHRSPDTLDVGELESYFLYLLRERNMANASVRVCVNGIRFFFREVLRRPCREFAVRYPKRVQRIPELLSREETQKILAHAASLKHFTVLATCYGTGLRVSELVALCVRDIDSAQQVIHVRQGKGHKDRAVILTPTLLQQLRHYWRHYRPSRFLFYGSHPHTPMGIETAQRAFRKAKQAAGIDKHGGIHSLRHAYATHQLEAGMPTFKLQRLLGHSNIKTTLRYVHWLPHYQNRGHIGIDLLASSPRCRS